MAYIIWASGELWEWDNSLLSPRRVAVYIRQHFRTYPLDKVTAPLATGRGPAYG